MSVWAILALVAMVLGAIATLWWFALHRAKETGAELANAEAERRQFEALKSDQERADEIERKADVARAAPAGDRPLADRLRASGRGRTTRK